MATGFASFDAVIRLASKSRVALLAGFRDGLEDAHLTVLAEETLPYLELARNGFALAVRVRDLSGLDAAAFLRRWGITSDSGEGSGVASPGVEVEREALGRMGRRPVLHDGKEALAAFGHARVALALIPRLPPSAVSWPPRPTYVDVPRPRGATELVERLEEIERTIWRLSVRRTPPERDQEPARRTLAFFDAIVYLGVDPRAPA